MSASMKYMAVNVSATAVASTAGFWGKLEGLSPTGWISLILVVFLSVIAASWAAFGQMSTADNVTPEQVRRFRFQAVTALAAQFILGMIAALQFFPSLEAIAASCLAIGWTGTSALRKVSKLSGFTDV
jgi:hypothetical protein